MRLGSYDAKRHGRSIHARGLYHTIQDRRTVADCVYRRTKAHREFCAAASGYSRRGSRIEQI